MTANKEFISNPSAQPTPKLMATTKVVSSDGKETEMAMVAGKGKGKGQSRKERRAVVAAAKALEQAAVSVPMADAKKKFNFSKLPPDNKPCHSCNHSGHWSRLCPYQKQIMAEFIQRTNINLTNDLANGGRSSYGSGSSYGNGSIHGGGPSYTRGPSYAGGPGAQWSGNANAGW
jgi:hypothetical protein